MTRQVCRLGSIFIACVTVLSPLAAAEITRNPFGVRETIARTRVLSFSAGATPNTEQVTLFSPGGSRFIVHTRRGDLQRNVNVESLLLYGTAQVQNFLESGEALPPAPTVLASVEVRHDWAALSSFGWLNENQLTFVTEGDNGRPQAFMADAVTGKISQLTHNFHGVVAFSVSRDTVVYYAHSPRQAAQFYVEPVNERVLAELLLPDYWHGWDATPLRLYRASLTRGEDTAIDAPASFTYQKQIWVSPSGRHAITFTPAVNWPSYWREYAVIDPSMAFTPQLMVTNPTQAGAEFRLRYQLLDLETGKSKPLLDAPAGMVSSRDIPFEVFWSSDDASVTVSNTYLPLRGVAGAELERRRHPAALVEVDLRTGEWRSISKQSVSPAANTQQLAAELVSVRQHQSPSERPRLYVASANTQRKLLLEPNPHFDRYTLSPLQPRKWMDSNGFGWLGGILLPTSYVAGRKYPLVVQTHGYFAEEYLIDGPLGAPTAYAAQALANAGFIVAQIADNSAATLHGGEKEGSLYAAGYRTVIESLIQEGLVDRAKIGLIAFSRTGLGAVALMAESPQLLAAANLSDVSYGGDYVGRSVLLTNYQDKMTLRQIDAVAGGTPESLGYCQWFSKIPLYRIRNAGAAVRFEVMGPASLLNNWEAYSVVKNANRPVDLIYFPYGEHNLKKPVEQFGSKQGNVDWFNFWLRGHEDAASEKRRQYLNWRAMRDSMSNENQIATGDATANKKPWQPSVRHQANQRRCGYLLKPGKKNS